MQWGKDSLFNKWCWENWITTCKRMKLEHPLTPSDQISRSVVSDSLRPHESPGLPVHHQLPEFTQTHVHRVSKRFFFFFFFGCDTQHEGS